MTGIPRRRCRAKLQQEWLLHQGAPVKTLIIEDEYISRVLLLEILSPLGECHVAVTGPEAVALIERAFDSDERYDLVCLDIMIPGLDGQQVLKTIRRMEADRGVVGQGATKVIMTTALDDSRNILEAFTVGKCDAYLTKPIDSGKLLAHLRNMQLVGRPGVGNAS